MRGMLIDNHDTRFGLGNDIVFMHLRTRRAQGMVGLWYLLRRLGMRDRFDPRGIFRHLGKTKILWLGGLGLVI